MLYEERRPLPQKLIGGATSKPGPASDQSTRATSTTGRVTPASKRSKEDLVGQVAGAQPTRKTKTSRLDVTGRALFAPVVITRLAPSWWAASRLPFEPSNTTFFPSIGTGALIRRSLLGTARGERLGSPLRLDPPSNRQPSGPGVDLDRPGSS